MTFLPWLDDEQFTLNHAIFRIICIIYCRLGTSFHDIDNCMVVLYKPSC